MPPRATIGTRQHSSRNAPPRPSTGRACWPSAAARRSGQRPQSGQRASPSLRAHSSRACPPASDRPGHRTGSAPGPPGPGAQWPARSAGRACGADPPGLGDAGPRDRGDRVQVPARPADGLEQPLPGGVISRSWKAAGESSRSGSLRKTPTGSSASDSSRSSGGSASRLSNRRSSRSTPSPRPERLSAGGTARRRGRAAGSGGRHRAPVLPSAMPSRPWTRAAPTLTPEGKAFIRGHLERPDPAPRPVPAADGHTTAGREP